MAEHWDLISVDDHIIEPRDVWSSRLPTALRDVGPRVVEENGQEIWVYEDRRHRTVGLYAIAGKTVDEYHNDPIRYSDMLPGCYDSVARTRDMDQEGIRASLCFPTFPRTCGQTFLEASDRDLALLCVEAYNDFVIDEWAGRAPGRFIPMVIGPLWDPDAYAAEIERTVDKGARAITFSENPARLGLPSFHSDHWDPVWRACEETGAVVCLHIGSSSVIPKTADDAPFAVTVALSPMNAQSAMSDLLLSRVPHQFPGLRFAMSEGGIGWVPFALEHCDYVWERHRWSGIDTATPPSEVFRRNFWVCFIDEEFGLRVRDEIGVDRIMWECDYPHSDTSYPNSQERVTKMLAGVPADEAALVTHGNAEHLFGLAPDLTGGARSAP
jgi:predicted TIM-barrel fold metal-dependent hydrolase